MIFAVAAVSTFLVSIVQASFFEWVFHRYWLHRPWLPKDVFTAHTLVHHQLCKYDDTFQVTEEEQHEAIHFQWWGGPFLILLNLIPWAVGLWLSSRWIQPPWVAAMAGVTVAFALYYAGYEGFHYLMHKPSIPFIERRGFFRFLERHHRIHHVQMDRNLNVLLPLADLVLGTLVLDAPIPALTPESARRLARRHSRSGPGADAKEA